MQEAKLFQSGQNQAVKLPKEFHFEGDAVTIRRIGDAVILQSKTSWDTLFDSLEQFSPDFLEERAQLPVQEREYL